MYTSGRTVKSKGGKQDLGLTPVKATRQARNIVQKIMPDAFATVESRLSHDLTVNVPLIITTVTFPQGHAARHSLGDALAAMPDRFAPLMVGDSSIAITRKI
jgi:hypothetical protein